MQAAVSAPTSTQIPTQISTPIASLGPVNCPCINAHYGAVVIERTYPVPVDVIFELLYAEAVPPGISQSALFTEQFLRSRGTTDLKMTPWRPLAGESELAELAKTCKDLGLYGNLRSLFAGEGDETGNSQIKNRKLEYTIELNHVLCKSCYTRERQFLLAQKSGSYYVVLSEAKNEGPPFSDNFVVCSTTCLSSAGNGQTKLTVQYKLCWLKISLSMRMLTGTIERSSKEGFLESAHDKLKRMEMHLKIIPADEHFLTTLAACSPEIAASWSASGAPLVSLQMTSSAVVSSPFVDSGLPSSQAANLQSSPSTLPATSTVLTSPEVIGSGSGQQASSLSSAEVVEVDQQTGNGTTSVYGILANVNLRLVILVLFTIAYIVLVSRVWAMEERLDKMAEYIEALLREDEAGDGQGGQSSARLEL